MCASDMNKKALRTAWIYLLVSLFCIFFGAVYEAFSHEVYSFYMIYAFVFPLAGGTLPFLFMSFGLRKKYPNPQACHLYHWGIATVTTGSIVQGVLEIYGTTNALAVIYWPVGGLLILAGIITFVLGGKKHEERE